ncbi:MAG: helix-turn-helix transcriptional regulator [Clostridium sp.]|nr:helix-turn-helix transcriptional regulator [Clostridium sp.]
MESNILGKRLKILRTEAGLTQEEFGIPYSLKKSTVSQYESGASRPDDELKKKIALDYNVSIDWLLGLTDIRNKEEVTIKREPTIALHSDYEYDELPDEAKKEIENFIEYVKAKYKK